MISRLTITVGLLCLWHGAATGQNVQERHRRLCDAGELSSCTVLGLIYETGAGGVRDLGRAAELYQRACDREVTAACLRLGLMRDGTDPDPASVANRMGRVADAVTGAPLPGAVVSVPELDVRVVADATGRVDLGRLPRGNYRMSARRLGYVGFEGDLPVPWDTEFLLLMDEAVAEEVSTVGRVFGRVTQEGTEDGLSDVEVTLLTPEPVTVISDAQGRFMIPDLDPGDFDIRFSRLGFETRTTSLTVEAGRTVEVSATMALQAIELEPIEVTVASQYLERTGFYARARTMGGGSSFTRMDVLRLDPITVADLLRRAPGVSIVRTRRGSQILGRRSVTRGDSCTLRAYLDGVPMFDDWSVDQLHPSVIDAVEIYQDPSIPIEYRQPASPNGTYACGVILIWTRRDR